MVTRTEASSAIRGITKIEHLTEHIPGGRGGVTWLKRCTFHVRGGGFVDIAFEGHDRQSFAEERTFRRGSGRVQAVRGLGKAAFRYQPDPTEARWMIFVFHPYNKIQGRRVPEMGSFVVFADAGVMVPYRNLLSLARAVTRHPNGPL